MQDVVTAGDQAVMSMPELEMDMNMCWQNMLQVRIVNSWSESTEVLVLPCGTSWHHQMSAILLSRWGARSI